MFPSISPGKSLKGNLYPARVCRIFLGCYTLIPKNSLGYFYFCSPSILNASMIFFAIPAPVYFFVALFYFFWWLLYCNFLFSLKQKMPPPPNKNKILMLQWDGFFLNICFHFCAFFLFILQYIIRSLPTHMLFLWLYPPSHSAILPCTKNWEVAWQNRETQVTFFNSVSFWIFQQRSHTYRIWNFVTAFS